MQVAPIGVTQKKYPARFQQSVGLSYRPHWVRKSAEGKDLESARSWDPLKSLLQLPDEVNITQFGLSLSWDGFV